MAASVAAGFLPPALALVVISMTTGAHSHAWGLISIGAGAIAGGLAAWAISNSIIDRAARIDALAEVILLNNQARKTFALNTDANYAGRDFVELCRDPRLQEFVASSTAGA